MEGSILKLTMEKGPREGETLECTAGSTVRIGRIVRGNTFAVRDIGISSKHLSVQFKDGKWVVSDLDTSNGTLLNDVKLHSLTPFDLRDGDLIKIGEYTSIRVNIKQELERDIFPGKNGRRATDNRGRASKRTKVLKVEPRESASGSNCGVGSCEEQHAVAENCDGRGASKKIRAVNGRVVVCALASIYRGQNLIEESTTRIENCGEPERVAIIAENRIRRGQRGKTRDSTNETASASFSALPKISEETSLGLANCEKPDNVVTFADNRTRRGHPRKAGAFTNEPLESECEVQKCPFDVAPVEEKQMQMSLGSRSSKEAQKIPEGLCLDQENYKDSGNEATVKGNQPKQSIAENSKGDTSPCVAVPISGSRRFNKRTNLQQETCEQSLHGFSVKEGSVNLNYGKDLENMTLEEWFDYLEVHLPKQICDITEEAISSMRERAKQFHEFISYQRNEKDKLLVA